MKRICVCGGRNYQNKELVYEILDKASKVFKFHLINGGARGADSLSSLWAYERACLLTEFPANWDKFKNAAGPIRNQEMLNFGFDCLIAFPGGSGTKHMVSITKKAGIPVLEVVDR